MLDKANWVTALSSREYNLENWKEIKAYSERYPLEFNAFLLLSRPEPEQDPRTFQPVDILNCELDDEIPTMDALFNCDQFRNASAVSCAECGEVLCGDWSA
jgi:hypothetical protein